MSRGSDQSVRQFEIVALAIPAEETSGEYSN